VIDAMTTHGLVSVTETTRGGDGTRLAHAAVAEGANLVVVMGGDGTVNEVAAALAGTTTALAPLPAGSTNVFARAIGWPHPARRALPVLIAALESPRFRDLTLGRIEAGPTDRIFCVNAGAGTDADTIHLVEARPWIKTKLRNTGVAGATLVATARAARRPASLHVSVDGGPARTFATLVVACGTPYAYLGSRPLELVPDAAFDGRLCWVGVASANPITTARVALGALRGGSHLTVPGVSHGWADEGIVVACDRPVAVQADGEPLGWHTNIRMAPGPTVRALVPPAHRGSVSE
jgi:diacylglycerol kinase family enzyme